MSLSSVLKNPTSPFPEQIGPTFFTCCYKILSSLYSIEGTRYGKNWHGGHGMAEMRPWITDEHGKTVDPHSIFSSSLKHLRGFLLFPHTYSIVWIILMLITS